MYSVGHDMLILWASCRGLLFNLDQMTGTLVAPGTVLGAGNTDQWKVRCLPS